MKKWSGLPIFIMGTSGTSREVKSMIEEINNINKTDVYQIVAFVDKLDGLKQDPENFKHETKVNEANGLKIIDEKVFLERIGNYPVVGVVIPFGMPSLKMKIYDQIANYKNVVYPNIIHPTAVIGENVEIGYGNVVVAGVTISPNVSIGNFCLINNNCNIGHDTVIEDFTVINPLSAISGDVAIRKGALVGARSAILQGVEVGENSQIGLGAFVVKNVSDNETVICVPAKVRKNDE